MAISDAARRCADAFEGGHTDTYPEEDTAAVVAVLAAVEAVDPTSGTQMDSRNGTTGQVTVGRTNIANKPNHTTKFTPDTYGASDGEGTWDGLQRR